MPFSAFIGQVVFTQRLIVDERLGYGIDERRGKVILEKVKDNKFCALILAAGKGTRMKSDLAKVLHVLEGKPLLDYSLAAAKSAGAEKIVVIIGHQASIVRAEFAASGAVFVEQNPQLGTGHAVLQAKDVLAGYSGLTVILCGDVPLLEPTTILGLIADHKASGAPVTVLTTFPADSRGYGRVVKDTQGNILKIVEERDASVSEKSIGEINTGIYCVDTPFLFAALGKITNNNKQHEYYLTDIVEVACREGFIVRAHIAPDYIEVMGINTPEELLIAGQYLQNNRKNLG
jgi:UDP-N-acetylglucosamine diphosphorylase/glucosamine-1-phosphate N-acetyltransferase